MQIGSDLLKDKGGIYQACKDYNSALGGSILSITDPHHDKSMQDSHVVYLNTSKDPFSRYCGRLHGENLLKLKQSLASRPRATFLHGCYRLTSKYVISAAREYQNPYIFVPHGGLDPWVFSYRRSLKLFWMKMYGIKMLRSANGVLAMTHNELRKIQRFVGKLQNQHVIYLPLETELCRTTESRDQVRSRMALPTDARVLCFLGRLHGMKRPMETIQAVLYSSKSLHLVVAGPDDSINADALAKYVLKHGAEDRVHIVGPLYGSSKYNLLNACDAYISLSHRENFNYTAAEAMALGLPVILSPGNDLQGELRNVNAGWLLESIDMQSVVEALRCFERSSFSDLRNMGANGKRWVSGELRFEQFQSRLNALTETF